MSTPSVCIIGGGAVGLATALHLARRGVTDVTVLEAEREIFVEERPLGLGTPRGTSIRRRVESLFGRFEVRRARSPRSWL